MLSLRIGGAYRPPRSRHCRRRSSRLLCHAAQLDALAAAVPHSFLANASLLSDALYGLGQQSDAAVSSQLAGWISPSSEASRFTGAGPVHDRAPCPAMQLMLSGSSYQNPTKTETLEASCCCRRVAADICGGVWRGPADQPVALHAVGPAADDRLHRRLQRAGSSRRAAIGGGKVRLTHRRPAKWSQLTDDQTHLPPVHGCGMALKHSIAARDAPLMS